MVTKYVVFFSLCLCVCMGMCIRSLNELRVLLLESPRHSAGVDWDLSREVHRAEWRMKEQKLQDDIKTLREKLLLLVRHGQKPATAAVVFVLWQTSYVTDPFKLKFKMFKM